MSNLTLAGEVRELNNRVNSLEAIVEHFIDAPMSQSMAARLLNISPATVGRRRSELKYREAFTATGRVKFKKFKEIWEASL